MSLSFSDHRLNTARAVRVIRRTREASDVATEARRRWGRATWFGVVTYVAWSPLTTVNKLLPAGSTTRGVVLTIIPVIGAVAVVRLPTRGQRKLIDVVVGLLAILVVWQAISVERSVGTAYLLHVIPSVALLLLAVSARGQVTEMSLTDIRFAATGVLPPVCCLLLLGWIAQFAHLVPVVPYNSAESAIAFSISWLSAPGLISCCRPFGVCSSIDHGHCVRSATRKIILVHASNRRSYDPRERFQDGLDCGGGRTFHAVGIRTRPETARAGHSAGVSRLCGHWDLVGGH